MVEPILFTTLRLITYDGLTPLTNASGFLFERDSALYLVTSRHVLLDEASAHRPDRIWIEFHTDLSNLATAVGFSIPLYRDGYSVWRDGFDGGGSIDVAAIAVDRSALPPTVVFWAFTPDNLARPDDTVEIGATLMVVGYPLGFHDSLHHLPVVRQATLASSFGLRFEGLGYFLTDARTHRGISGAPVVLSADRSNATRRSKSEELSWLLLGVHSARLDIGTRDLILDEALGLNCTWYADILMTLTE